MWTTCVDAGKRWTATALPCCRSSTGSLSVCVMTAQQGLLPPIGVDLAVNAASEQGWRRPLLAWLGVQLKRAEAGNDLEAKARIQRRIDLARIGAPGRQ
jgi:soluble P-type ATPase